MKLQFAAGVSIGQVQTYVNPTTLDIYVTTGLNNQFFAKLDSSLTMVKMKYFVSATTFIHQPVGI